MKLRLRGKGSGYKEGPDQLESEESLHLCISAKDDRIYNFACESVEKLLQNVYVPSIVNFLFLITTGDIIYSLAKQNARRKVFLSIM